MQGFVVSFLPLRVLHDALEVIPVPFIYQVIPEASCDQSRGGVEGSAAKGAEDVIIRTVGGSHFQDVADPVIEGISELFRRNWLHAIRVDIWRGAGQHIHLERLCQRNGNNIVGFEYGHAGRIDDRVSSQFSSHFLTVIVVISNQIRERQSTVQIAAPAETSLLCHRAACDTSTRRVGIGEAQDGNTPFPDKFYFALPLKSTKLADSAMAAQTLPLQLRLRSGNTKSECVFQMPEAHLAGNSVVVTTSLTAFLR